jgi:exopolysaccharide biosynthesis polyprenyl glycosylphosphotransferase
MFRQHAKLFTTLQFISDLALSSLAFPLAYITRVHIDGNIPWDLDRFLNPELHPISFYIPIMALALCWWSAIAYTLGLYRIGIRRSDFEKVRVVLESAILMALFLGFLSFAFQLNLSRPLIALFALYQVLLLLLARLIVAVHSRARAVPADGRSNILIIGNSLKARQMGELVARYREWGLRNLGFVTVDGREELPRTDGVLGSVQDLPEIIEQKVVDEIIFVGESPKDLDCFEDVLQICQEQGIRTRVAVDIFPAKVSKVSMDFLENVPILTFSMTPDHALSLFVKRAMDVVLSALVLAFSIPFMFVIGALIRLTSKGPAIYRQIRCGLYGRKFVLYKFRSMKEGAEDVLWEIKHLNEMDGPVFKMRNDPRVTALGRFLRKSSIDEWPQFWNVLKGDMSLVGPRAPLPEEVKEYTRWQRRRLSVKPGITCLWQVSGRNEIDFHEWMKLDLHYIDNWSLLLDLKIILRTFPVVLLGRGAR